VTTIDDVKIPREIGAANADTFDYLQSVSDRPLVGISTDGFTWRLYTARPGEEPSFETQQRLYRDPTPSPESGVRRPPEASVGVA
jgi:hypothetical protein